MDGEEQNVPGHVQSRPPGSHELPCDTSNGEEGSPPTQTQVGEGYVSENRRSNHTDADAPDPSNFESLDSSASFSSTSTSSTSTSMDEEAKRQKKIAALSAYLYSVHKEARTSKMLPIIRRGDVKLVEALNDAATFAEFKDPLLLSYAADIVARFSQDPESAPKIANRDFISVLDGVLNTRIPSSSSQKGRSVILEAWGDAALAVRNIAELSEEAAKTVSHKSELLKHVIRHIEYNEPGPNPHLHNCMAALANIARHGDIFKNRIHKYGGLSAVASHARQNTSPKVRLQALRVLAEFSTCPKWIPLIISEDVIESVLTTISDELYNVDIASEAATFIGNVASNDDGREVIVKNQGVIVLTNRLTKWRANLPILDFEYSPADKSLPVDIIRAIGNLCYQNERAARTVLVDYAMSALISGCDDNVNQGLDDETKKQLKAESTRGILTVAYLGHTFKVETIHQLTFRLHQDVKLGRSPDYLLKLIGKLYEGNTEDCMDTAPQTIEELGRASEKYTAYSLEHAYKYESEEKHSEIFSEKQARPVIRVARPNDPNSEFIPQATALNKAESDSARRKGFTLFSKDVYIDADLGHTSRSNSNGRGLNNEILYKSEQGTPPIPSRSSRRDRKSATYNTSKGVGHWARSSSKSIVHRPSNPTLSSNTNIDTLDEMEADNYEIGPILGRGAFATVYLAKNLQTKELVAVKRLHPPVSDNDDDNNNDNDNDNDYTKRRKKKADLAARKVVREQRITRRLEHKNVVRYRGCFFGERGELNIIADYVPGWSLSDHLFQHGKFPEHMVARIARQIVDGLEYLHGKGVVHRDLKPSNLLVSPAGVIKMTDYGAGTGIGIDIGAWYLSPEVILKSAGGNAAVGVGMDIWALGCTVYELACGHRPYHNLEQAKAMMKLAKDRVPAIPGEFSYNLEKFIKACWKWDAKKRATAAELREHDFLKNLKSPKLKDLKNKSRPLAI